MATKNNKKYQKELITLARIASLKSGQLFDLNKGAGEVLTLLRWTMTVEDEEVKRLLGCLSVSLPAAHKRLFEDSGIVFGNPSHIEDETAIKDEAQKGKKRIVYRGQEKWV